MTTRNMLCVSSLRVELRNVSPVSQFSPPKVPRSRNADTQELRTLECGRKRSATPLLAARRVPINQTVSAFASSREHYFCTTAHSKSCKKARKFAKVHVSTLGSSSLRHVSMVRFNQLQNVDSLHLPEPSSFQTLNLRTSLSVSPETSLRKTETSHPKLRQFGPLSTSYANFLLRQTQYGN
jgi:hypothetical protein